MNNAIYFYIHIPYCYKKCPYCSFVSFEKQLKTIDAYTSTLLKEIKNFKTKKVVKSIYFGGGTPSILKPDYITNILDAIYSKFSVDGAAEITFEANPVSLKTEYLNSLKSIGINRLSIGIQSFIDKKLEILGRLHNAKGSIESVKKAQNAGFDNISIDLIYGLKETKSEIEFELKKACSLGIQHISTYMLSIEKDTPFEKRLREGELEVSKDDELAYFYIFISRYLENEGFEHYEISNFAKNGFISRHNSAYWLGFDYRGFGVSASSFIDNTRFRNTDNLFDYIHEKNIIEKDTINEITRMKEDFVLLLRTKKGVDIKKFNKKYNIEVEKLFENELKKFKSFGLIKEQDGKISLNGAKAMVVSNAIFSEFM